MHVYRVSRSWTILRVTSANQKLLLSTVPVGIVRRMPQTPLLRPPRIFDGFLLDTFSKTPSNPRTCFVRYRPLIYTVVGFTANARRVIVVCCLFHYHCRLFISYLPYRVNLNRRLSFRVVFITIILLPTGQGRPRSVVTIPICLNRINCNDPNRRVAKFADLRGY